MSEIESKINENLENKLSVLFGSIGILAITINLSIKGFTAENFLDAIKDVAEMAVTIAVFLAAKQILKKMKNGKTDFTKIFDGYIERWAADNKYLIDSSKMNESQSEKYDTRIVYMILDLTSFGEKNAEEYNSKQKIGRAHV